jgi:hypothetical protein
MAGNDAEGKQPTVEEEMAKFTGFSVKDGETDSGKPTAEEEAAALANRSSHEENTRRAAAAPAAKEEKTPVELSDEESEAAITAAQEAAGDEELTDEEKEAAVSAALAEKTKAAAKPQHSKNSAAKRISNLTRAQRQAERDRDTARAEAAELRRQLANGGKSEAPLTNEGKNERKEIAGKPDPSDTKKYEYGELDAKYIADLTRWTVLDAQDEAKHKESSTQQSKADEAATEAFETAKAAFEEAGLDQFGDEFQEVIDSLELSKDDPDFWPLSPVLGELLLESEAGPAMAKELASNPKEARRIHKLTPARQAAWFGVKEAELLANSGAGNEEKEEGTPAAAARKPLKTLPPKESKAPAPLPNARALNGSGGNRIPNSATPDFAAFEALASGGGRK